MPVATFASPCPSRSTSTRTDVSPLIRSMAPIRRAGKPPPPLDSGATAGSSAATCSAVRSGIGLTVDRDVDATTSASTMPSKSLPKPASDAGTTSLTAVLASLADARSCPSSPHIAHRSQEGFVLGWRADADPQPAGEADVAHQHAVIEQCPPRLGGVGEPSEQHEVCVAVGHRQAHPAQRHHHLVAIALDCLDRVE